jgi:mitochondrial fission protein ELM1
MSLRESSRVTLFISLYAILLSLNFIGLESVSLPAAAERLQSYGDTSTLVTRDGKKDVGVSVWLKTNGHGKILINIQSSNLARHFDPVIDSKRDQRVN